MRQRSTKPPPGPKAVPRPAPPLVPEWLLAALLAVATIALYWPALSHGFVNYDDDRYVTANPQVQAGLTLANIRWAFVNPVADNWHPLTVIFHMLVCQFSGINPWGHHLASVLLHAANAALVFVWLRLLTGSIWKSLVVAALFAAHPLRVESVAWVAESKDVLSGLFGLLALIAYTRYAKAQTVPGKTGPFIVSRSYWLALFWFALGLMSKPMLVTWPFVLLLLDFWPLTRFKPGCAKGLILEKIPFFILTAAASVVTYLVQKRGGAAEMIGNLPLAARCENAVISYCRYLGKIFYPTNLAVLYPHPGHWPATLVFLAAGFLLIVTVAMVWQRRQHPHLLVGWLWFIGTLIPVIGLVQVGLQSMADRYTYLPSLGILISVVWGTDELTRHWSQRALFMASVSSALIVLCGILTRTQLQYWQDGETLFRHTLAVTESNYVAHYDLGVALDDQNRQDEAMHEYQAALLIQTNFARAYVNLGVDLDKAGQSDAAMQQYQEAVRVAPDNAYARNNLGITFFKHGQNEEAVRQFREAVRLAPDNAGNHNSLAAALYTQGQPDEAIHEFEEAIRLQPDYAEAHFNLACVLVERGQTGEAIKHFREAIRLKPDYTDASDRLAKLLATPVKNN